VCGVARLNDRGDITERDDLPCHANLGYDRAKTGNTVAICSTLWYHRHAGLNHDAVQEYWLTILDPEVSPWRSVIKGFTLYHHEGELIGFATDNMDGDLDVFVGLCIATRVPYEHPRHIHSFTFFRANGFSPIESVYLSYLFHKDREDSALYFGGKSDWHFPVNPKSSVSFKAFKEGKTGGKGRSTIGNNAYGYGKIGTMFSSRDSSSREEIEGIVLNVPALKVEDSSYDGIFPDLYAAWEEYQEEANEDLYGGGDSTPIMPSPEFLSKIKEVLHVG